MVQGLLAALHLKFVIWAQKCSCLQNIHLYKFIFYFIEVAQLVLFYIWVHSLQFISGVEQKHTHHSEHFKVIVSFSDIIYLCRKLEFIVTFWIYCNTICLTLYPVCDNIFHDNFNISNVLQFVICMKSYHVRDNIFNNYFKLFIKWLFLIVWHFVSDSYI